ncbi:hypothetical protein EDC04DRAFT_2599915 [Pisolithus marmoratus]|nr:hypothetical protein EDC04DRAFT_2599915 [Pisolithus marmoratus]
MEYSIWMQWRGSFKSTTWNQNNMATPMRSFRCVGMYLKLGNGTPTTNLSAFWGVVQAGIADPVIDHRMELFLHHVQKFIHGIIFNNLPCLKRNGYQWVPRSFLDKTYAADTMRMHYMLVDVGYPAYEAVLHMNLHSIRGSGARYLGICLESAASHHPITIIAGDGDVCYHVQLLLDETSDFSGWNCTT